MNVPYLTDDKSITVQVMAWYRRQLDDSNWLLVPLMMNSLSLADSLVPNRRLIIIQTGDDYENECEHNSRNSSATAGRELVWGRQLSI